MKTSIEIAAAVALALFTMSCATARVSAPAAKGAVSPKSAPPASPIAAASMKPSDSDGLRELIRMSVRMPAEAALGDEFAMDLTLTAQGGATNVVMRNPIPANASYVRSEPAATVEGDHLVWQLGNLDAGQTRSARIWFQAGKEGAIVNCATVSTGARVCGTTLVGKPVIAIDQSGPETAVLGSNVTYAIVGSPDLKVEQSGTKEQFLGRNADYEIVVSNPGDTPLRNVVVSNRTPPGIAIVAAPGATLGGNQATWNIAELKPGAKYSATLKLTAKVVGTHCNNVTVSSGGLSDSAKACTLWKGIAAVSLEAVDEPDPIQVGESTTYTIKVTNQGSADLHNLKILARFADQVTPFSAAPGSISDKLVSFPAVTTLGAKQTLTNTILVKGDSPGDSRNQITLTCDELKTPVTKEESTTVY